MTKIQVDSNGKVITLGGKALVASEGGTPTGTLNITTNGVYDVTNYASANVSVSGGSYNIDSFCAYATLNHSFDDYSDFPTEYADAIANGDYFIDNVMAYIICNFDSSDNYTAIQLIVATYLTNGSDILPFSFKIYADEGFSFDSQAGVITFTNANALFIFPGEGDEISGIISIELSFEYLRGTIITNAN